MSTATATLQPSAARGAGTRPGLVRLTATELRKMVDTRAGFWLQLAVLGLTIAVVWVRVVTGSAEDHTLRAILGAAVWPANILLPVVGILLVTSEWSQRTTLTTFALVPNRWRVLAAKAFAGTMLSMAALVMCLTLAVVATFVADPGSAGTWSLPGALLAQDAVFLVTAMIMGLGFGAALLSSPLAIVLYFALPIGWSALGTIHAITPTARWLDGGRSLSPMPDHVMDATEWARAGTTLAVWMALPLLVGLWRVMRSEIT